MNRHELLKALKSWQSEILDDMDKSSDCGEYTDEQAHELAHKATAFANGLLLEMLKELEPPRDTLARITVEHFFGGMSTGRASYNVQIGGSVSIDHTRGFSIIRDLGGDKPVGHKFGPEELLIRATLDPNTKTTRYEDNPEL